jgi:hypothetical protein
MVVAAEGRKGEGRSRLRKRKQLLQRPIPFLAGNVQRRPSCPVMGIDVGPIL